MKCSKIKRILSIDNGVIVIKLDNDDYKIIYSKKHTRLFIFLDDISIKKRYEYIKLENKIKEEKDIKTKNAMFEELIILSFFLDL